MMMLKIKGPSLRGETLSAILKIKKHPKTCSFIWSVGDIDIDDYYSRKFVELAEERGVLEKALDCWKLHKFRQASRSQFCGGTRWGACRYIDDQLAEELLEIFTEEWGAICEDLPNEQQRDEYWMELK